jgi:membrane-bound lytic murein transglycosylase F
MKKHATILAHALLLCLSAGCGKSGVSQPASDSQSTAGDSTNAVVGGSRLEQEYIEKGDIDALREKGVLRILVHRNLESYLPRQGHPDALVEHGLQRFAEQHGMHAKLVVVADFNELIPMLNSGKGDVISANLAVTEQRQQQIAFSHALTHVTQHIVSPASNPLKNLAELKQRTLLVQENTSFFPTAKKLQTEFKGLKLEPVSGELNDEAIYDRLVDENFSVTLADSNVIDAVLAYRDDLKKSGAISAEQAIALGVRKTNPQLLSDMNDYIIHYKMTRPRMTISVADWPEIQKRGFLRVALPNTSASYFMLNGKLQGFDFELFTLFAEQHKLGIQVVVASDQDQLLDMVRSGTADVAGGFLTPNPMRERDGIDFASPYHMAAEMVVARADDSAMASTQDLAGRTIHVRESSSYWQTVLQLQKDGIAVKLAATPEDEETESAIAKVASSEYDLSVADENILKIEQTWRNDVGPGFALTEPLGQAWALRSQNPRLLQQFNAFIKKEYRGLLYNIAYKKYFTAPKTVASLKQGQRELVESGTISPYDALIKKYATQYGFDWRLVAAQMYQETRFDPKVKSWVGAQGLLQVMPATAREMGFKSINTTEQGIAAGIKYLDHVRQQFPDSMPVIDRMWFTLAAYNAGSGHVRDAIVLAKQQGLKPDRWFDNVEKAMLLLSKKQYAAKARYGYVRGQEPVKYVREIRQRFNAYVQLTDVNEAARELSPAEEEVTY